MSSKPPRGNRFKRTWTKSSVKSAIKQWEKKFGRPPTEAEWNPARSKFLMAGSQTRVDHWAARIKEYATGKYPSSRTVQDMYDGRWAEGIKDAGFIPLPSGRPSKQNLSLYARRANDNEADEVALFFQWEEVKKALQDPDNKVELRQALIDLASIAATYADELRK